jgi:hypothetical protein
VQPWLSRLPINNSYPNICEAARMDSEKSSHTFRSTNFRSHDIYLRAYDRMYQVRVRVSNSPSPTLTLPRLCLLVQNALGFFLLVVSLDKPVFFPESVSSPKLDSQADGIRCASRTASSRSRSGGTHGLYFLGASGRCTGSHMQIFVNHPHQVNWPGLGHLFIA